MKINLLQFLLNICRDIIGQTGKLFTLGALVFAAQSVCSADTELAGKYYESAVMEYRQGNIKAAIIELKNAIQQNPDYLTAYTLMTEAQLQDGNIIAAEVALQQADRLGVDPALVITTRAKLYLTQLKYDKIIKDILPDEFQRSLRADLHIYRGHAYLQVNRPGYALDEYNQAQHLQPDSVDPVIGKANVYLRLGKLESAMEMVEKAAKMQPDAAASWYIKGSIFHVQGKLLKAIENYGQALKQEPEFHDARTARAGVLMDLQRYKEAENDLVYLREVHPFDARTAYLHSVVLAKTGKADEAKHALVSAAEALDTIKPEYLVKHAQSLMLAGLVNYSLKRFDVAVQYLEKYIRNNPAQPGPYKLMASILLDKGDNDAVIKLLRSAKAFAPRDHRLLFLLGRAYMQNGQHDLANNLFKEAADLGVQGGEITTQLGLNQLAMGQDELAMAQLESALSKQPGNTRAGIPLFLQYMNKRQPEKALRVINKMLSEDPENLTLINLLGTAQVGIGKRAMARQNFLKTTQKDPGFITGHINLSKLDVLEGHADAGKQRLQQLIKKYPKNVALKIELATIYRDENDSANASMWLEQAIKSDTKSVPAKLALVKLKLKTGHFTEALRVAQDAQKLDRENMETLELLAQSFMANGNAGKASGVLQVMVRKAGFNARQLYRIALLQLSAGDHEGAIKSLKNAVTGSEHYMPARIALAEAELQFGNSIFASNHAEFLKQRYPEKAVAYRLLGDIAQHEGKTELAVRHYQTAFSKEPDVSILMRLYLSLKQSGDNDKALILLEKWVADHPQDSVPVQALAEEHLYAGRLQKAQVYYEQLLQSHADKPDFLNNLAYIYFALKDERALDFAIKAQQLAPEQASANDTLGWILVNEGQAERGLHYLRSAHARSSQDPEIRYHIAVALMDLNRVDEAKVELKQALRLSPVFNGSEQAKILLKELSN